MSIDTTAARPAISSSPLSHPDASTFEFGYRAITAAFCDAKPSTSAGANRAIDLANAVDAAATGAVAPLLPPTRSRTSDSFNRPSQCAHQQNNYVQFEFDYRASRHLQ